MDDPKKIDPTPDAQAVPAADPSAPVPNAAAEPATQVAAAAAAPAETAGAPTAPAPPSPTARPLPPPLPADYAMPDDYASDSPLDAVKAWAEANPGLAIVAAAGVGLVVGRIVTAMVPDPAPPTLQKRVETRARALKKAGVHRAEDASDVIAERLQEAADAIRGAAGTAVEKSEEGLERTKDLAEHIADAVKVAVTGVAAKKLDDWMDKVKG